MMTDGGSEEKEKRERERSSFLLCSGSIFRSRSRHWTRSLLRQPGKKKEANDFERKKARERETEKSLAASEVNFKKPQL